jgi:hypothetical protein
VELLGEFVVDGIQGCSEVTVGFVESFQQRRVWLVMTVKGEFLLWYEFGFRVVGCS